MTNKTSTEGFAYILLYLTFCLGILSLRTFLITKHLKVKLKTLKISDESYLA